MFIEVKIFKNYFFCRLFNLLILVVFENFKIGEIVFIVGIFFGGECLLVFYNSFLKGIVFNVVGKKSEIMIIDVCCVLGCEGCLVYLKKLYVELIKDNVFYGIVLVLFCWRNGEWIGIIVMVLLECILCNLLIVLNKRIVLIF